MCIYLIRCQWWTILNKLDFFLISFFELLPWTLFLTHFSVSIKVSSETKAKCQRKTITYSFYLFRMNLHLETKRQELSKLWEISIVQSFLDKKKKISFSTYISRKLFIIHVLILSHISVIFQAHKFKLKSFLAHTNNPSVDSCDRKHSWGRWWR